MAEIINLRLARKAKQREDRAQEAATNRAKSAQTKAQKTGQAVELRRAERALNHAKIERD